MRLSGRSRERRDRERSRSRTPALRATRSCSSARSSLRGRPRQALRRLTSRCSASTRSASAEVEDDGSIEGRSRGTDRTASSRVVVVEDGERKGQRAVRNSERRGFAGLRPTRAAAANRTPMTLASRITGSPLTTVTRGDRRIARRRPRRPARWASRTCPPPRSTSPPAPTRTSPSTSSSRPRRTTSRTSSSTSRPGRSATPLPPPSARWRS